MFEDLATNQRPAAPVPLHADESPLNDLDEADQENDEGWNERDLDALLDSLDEPGAESDPALS